MKIPMEYNKNGLNSGNFVFLILFFVYFLSNIVFYISARLNSNFSVDGVEFEVNGGLGWLLILTLFFLIIHYYIVKKINTKRIIEINFLKSNHFLLCFSIAYQVIFYFHNTFYGYGIAGQAVSQSSILKYFFYIVSPDALAMIVSVLVLKSRLYYFNLLFFVFSMLSRGWAGGILFFAFILLINSNYSGVFDFFKKNKTKILIFFILGAISIPVINAFKFWIRGSGSEDFLYYLSYFFGGEDFSIIKDSIFYLISRFSIVGSISVISDNQDILREAYAAGEIAPYWTENIFVSTLYQMSSVVGANASNYIATEILGYSGATWNTHVGLVGWLIILPIEKAFVFYFYYLIILFLGLFLAKILGQRTFVIVSVLSLTYLYHGWISSYILIICCLVFILIFRLMFKFKL